MSDHDRLAAGCARDYAQYERVREACMREYERKIEDEVAQAFARLRDASEDDEIPWIGDLFPPAEYRDGLQARVVRALCARKWFTFEAPAWAQPLPLTLADCIALYNRPSPPRLWPVGQYGVHLRQAGWDLRYVEPFEVFCAPRLVPMPRQRPL